MQTGIKAIETVYRGYRFRSRAEARWARFMDAAGVEWTYEDEGYDLDGVRYLPDFHLSKLDAWLEVKGARPGWDDQAFVKALRLAKASGKRVYIISGEIGPEYAIDAFSTKRMFCQRWCRCVRCGMVGIADDGNGAALPCSCFRPDEYYRSDDWQHIQEALLAARQERFGT